MAAEWLASMRDCMPAATCANDTFTALVAALCAVLFMWEETEEYATTTVITTTPWAIIYVTSNTLTMSKNKIK